MERSEETILKVVEQLTFYFRIGYKEAHRLANELAYEMTDMDDWLDFKEQMTHRDNILSPVAFTNKFLRLHKNPRELKWFKPSRKLTCEEVSQAQHKEKSREPAYGRPAVIKSNPEAIGWEEFKRRRTL